MLVADGRPIGGLTGRRPGSECVAVGWPCRPLGRLLGTADVDTAANRTAELGGKVLLGPLDIPNTGRVAVLRDPDGATFGVFDPASGTA